MVDQKFLDEMNLILSSLLRTYTSGEFTITSDMVTEHELKKEVVTVSRVDNGYQLKLGD